MRIRVKSEAQLAEAVKRTAGKIIAFDTETTGLELTRKLVGFSFSIQENGTTTSWYVPVAHTEVKEDIVVNADNTVTLITTPSPHNVKFESRTLRDYIKDLFTLPVTVVLHNGKFDLNTIRRELDLPFWEFTSAIHDTLIAGWLVSDESLGADTEIEDDDDNEETAPVLVTGKRQALTLGALAEKHLNKKKSFKDFIVKYKGKRGKVIQVNSFPFAKIDDATYYAAGDTELTLELYHALSKRIQQWGLTSIYEKLECRLLLLVSDMEYRGVLIDVEKLVKAAEDIAVECKELYLKISELLGRTPDTKEVSYEEYEENGKKKKKKITVEYNIKSINSPKWLRENMLGVHWTPHNTLTDTGLVALGAIHLLAWADGTYGATEVGKEVAHLLYRYKKLDKIRSSFSDKFQRAIDDNSRLHGNFTQTGTNTGRFSSSNPNLQNISAGREDSMTGELPKVRSAFICEDGYVMVGSDFSQVELRVLAHFSNDPNMMDAFNTGIDLHTKTASEVFGVPIDSVTKSQRAVAKTINFGLVYGMGPTKLAKTLKIDVDTARDYMQKYFAAFPNVKMFFTKNVAAAYRDGYVKTIFGRRRYLPDLYALDKYYQEDAISEEARKKARADAIRMGTFIKPSDEATAKHFADRKERESRAKGFKASAERQANNTVIQGSAADIIKLSMVRILDKLLEKGYIQDGRAYVTMQIHDELIMECHASVAEEVRDIMKSCMEGSTKNSSGKAFLKVKLDAEPAIARNMYELK